MKKTNKFFLAVILIIIAISFGCANTFQQSSLFPSTPYITDGFKSKGARIGFIAPSSSYGLE